MVFSSMETTHRGHLAPEETPDPILDWNIRALTGGSDQLIEVVPNPIPEIGLLTIIFGWHQFPGSSASLELRVVVLRREREEPNDLFLLVVPRARSPTTRAVELRDVAAATAGEVSAHRMRTQSRVDR